MRTAWILALALPASMQAAGNPDFTMRAGARALGMGEAVAAAQGGLESLAWNPAGLSGEAGPSLLLGHTDWVGQPSESLAAALPLGAGVLGIGGHFNGAPELLARDAQGQPLGNLVYRNMGGTLAWAQQMGALSLGVAAGGWQLEQAGLQNSGTQVNAGLQFKAGGINLGAAGFQVESSAAWQGSAQWATEGDGHSVVLGLGYIAEGADSRWGLGGEVGIAGKLALRAGWQQPVEASVLQGLSGLSAGLGAQLGAMSLDYAWMPLGELGQVQRMQLGWRFNTAPAPAPVTKRKVKAAEAPAPAPVPVAVPVEVPKTEVKLKFVVPAD